MSWKGVLAVALASALISGAAVALVMSGRGGEPVPGGTRTQGRSSGATVTAPLSGTAGSDGQGGGGQEADGQRASGEGAGEQAAGGQEAVGIPELQSPERPTIALLGKDFATGLVRCQVSLRVIGWQGSSASGGLVVRFLSAKPTGPGKIRTPLEIAENDFVVTMERRITGARDLEGKPVTVEFRPEGDGFSAYIR